MLDFNYLPNPPLFFMSVFVVVVILLVLFASETKLTGYNDDHLTVKRNACQLLAWYYEMGICLSAFPLLDLVMFLICEEAASLLLAKKLCEREKQKI